MTEISISVEVLGGNLRKHSKVSQEYHVNQSPVNQSSN